MVFSMNLSAAPNTPIRTPQSRSSNKSLQLTPIWEEVVKNGRLPEGVSQDLIFQEISLRLEDLEWPVRQHAFRVLHDIIQIISREHLDEQITQSNILEKLILNLGHPAPGIRKVAAETIQKYLERSAQTEKMLKSFLEYGIKKKESNSNDPTEIPRKNVTLGTIVALVDVLKPFIVPENKEYPLFDHFLEIIIQTVAEKARNLLYRENCLQTLARVQEMVGKNRFTQILNKLPDGESIIYSINEKNDFKSNDANSYEGLMNQDSFEAHIFTEERNSRNNDVSDKDASSEDFSDGTDTETYTKEPAPSLDDDDTFFYQVDRAEKPHFSPSRFVPVSQYESFSSQEKAAVEKDYGEKKVNGSFSSKVLLEAEIQLTKNKFITMKVTDDEDQSQTNEQLDPQRQFTTENGDFVMKVLRNSEEFDDEEKTRTPRRVRFGGEIIKLRTPDSDTPDITIEIHEDNDTSKTSEESTIGMISESVIEAGETKFQQRDPKSPNTATLTPLKKAPSRDSSPSKRVPGSKIPVLKESSLFSKTESLDSAPSSSGSEGEGRENWKNSKEDVWRWAELRLVEENILKDLKTKENWKIQYQALEQLKLVLINPKTIERIEKLNDSDKVNSLLKCLLFELPETHHHQVNILAVSIVGQLIETLPKELILVSVKDIVQGLCKYIGGCKNLNLKIEAVQSLKMLFGILEPFDVIDVLVGSNCLFSSSSKLRENSLIAIMYAIMTFPSCMFDLEKILEKLVISGTDTRRRVRHAFLEAIAVLSQFCSAEALSNSVARVAATLPSASAKTQLIAAVQARLSRRLLPTISNEGLILYALQIPASKKLGILENPMGADIDWILSGTGSVSIGSAKSKTHPNPIQKLELKPSDPLVLKKWPANERNSITLHDGATKVGSIENPWKIQKLRTESAVKKNYRPKNDFLKTRSSENLNEMGKINQPFLHNGPNIKKLEKRSKPEEITWALVPITTLEEPFSERKRSNSLWGESFGENNTHYLSSTFGPLRPMYLKLQPTHDQLLLSRSSDDIRRNSYSQASRKESKDLSEIRLLTPSLIREKNYSDDSYLSGKLQSIETRGFGDIPTKIPVLCSNNSKNAIRASRPLHLGSNSSRIPKRLTSQ